MTTRDRIAQALTRAFSPSVLNVVDESERHKGHVGHRPEGETHFRVTIIAEAFRDKSRLQAHRMVYDVLAAEISGGVHALAIDAKAG